jgi:flagellar biosynthesis protein FlhB
MLAGAAAVAMLGNGLLQATRRLVAAMLAEAGTISGTWSGQVAAAAWALGGRAALMLLIVMAAAVTANVVQFGLLFSGEPMQWDFARLSPVGGLKRMLSLRSAVRAGLGAVKVLAAAGLAALAVRAAMSRWVRAESLSAADVADTIGRQVIAVSLWIATALLAVALLDLIYQRWQYRQDLKMTRREILEDLRKTEGDERIRQRRRRLRSKLVSGRQGT